MSKLKLTQVEIDKLVTVDRVESNSRVFGVGRTDVLFPVNLGQSSVWQYRVWHDVIRRSYSPVLKQRCPTYKDVTCCDEWLSFTTFLAWVNKEVGYGGKPTGFHLDKDLIIKGNRVYSPEACSFVPRAVNVLLTDHRAARGEYPQGVNYHKKTGKFVVQLSVDGKQKHLGLFLTPEDAFAAYKIEKEAHIKVVALQHKDVLKPAVFESLMNWEIGIDD